MSSTEAGMRASTTGRNGNWTTRRARGPHHEPGEPLLDLVATAIGAHTLVVLEESLNEELELAAAAATPQIIRRHLQDPHSLVFVDEPRER